MTSPLTWGPAPADTRLPLYTMYSDSHEELYRNWLARTITPDFVLHAERLPFLGSEVYRSDAWRHAIEAKVAYIIAVIHSEAGRMFVFADADVQFFREFANAAETLLGIDDIVCQAESPAGTFCTGLFLCRASSGVEQLWQDVALRLRRKSSSGAHDQDLFNDIVRSRQTRLRCGYLPPTFLGGGTLTGRRWMPGDFLPIPRGLVAHHANFTVGVRNKIAQLEYVRRSVGTSATLGDEEIARLLRNWQPPP